MDAKRFELFVSFCFFFVVFILLKMHPRVRL